MTVDVRDLKIKARSPGLRSWYPPGRNSYRRHSHHPARRQQVVVVVGQAPALKITPPPEFPPTERNDLCRTAGGNLPIVHRLATHHVVVIAGFPGMGKTALAVRLAERATTNPNKVFVNFMWARASSRSSVCGPGFLITTAGPGDGRCSRVPGSVGGQPHSVEVSWDYLVPLLARPGLLALPGRLPPGRRGSPWWKKQ